LENGGSGCLVVEGESACSGLEIGVQEGGSQIYELLVEKWDYLAGLVSGKRRRRKGDDQGKM
jgi:hypothetical protein